MVKETDTISIVACRMRKQGSSNTALPHLQRASYCRHDLKGKGLKLLRAFDYTLSDVRSLGYTLKHIAQSHGWSMKALKDAGWRERTPCVVSGKEGF